MVISSTKSREGDLLLLCHEAEKRYMLSLPSLLSHGPVHVERRALPISSYAFRLFDVLNSRKIVLVCMVVVLDNDVLSLRRHVTYRAHIKIEFSKINIANT